MSPRLEGVVLLPADGALADPAVDIAFEDGRIAAITPSVGAVADRAAAVGDRGDRRRLALPALVNAHDHARPLSPTSFGAAGKPLETWLLRLAAMPPIDPYLGALAAFGRGSACASAISDRAAGRGARAAYPCATDQSPPPSRQAVRPLQSSAGAV